MFKGGTIYPPFLLGFHKNLHLNPRKKQKTTRIRVFILKVSAFFNFGDGLFVSVGILKGADPQQWAQTIVIHGECPDIIERGGSPKRSYNAQGGFPMWRPFWFFSSSKVGRVGIWRRHLPTNLNGGRLDPPHLGTVGLWWDLSAAKRKSTWPPLWQRHIGPN